MLLRLSKRMFLLFGLVITKAITSKRISEVLRMVRPVSTGLELIRVGAKNDGGYLVPLDFTPSDIKAVISPGIGEVCDFEYYFADLGIPVFLIDKSVDSLHMTHKHFCFLQMFVAPKDNSLSSEISLQSLIGKVDREVENNQQDLILQMDVEGAEWRILASAQPETLRRFRIMAIEFHDFSETVAAGFAGELAIGVLEKILEDFVVVHAHLNNVSRTSVIRSKLVPKVVEITFLRKDRVPKHYGNLGSNNEDFEWAEVPHKLDAPNLENVPESKIPRDWR